MIGKKAKGRSSYEQKFVAALKERAAAGRAQRAAEAAIERITLSEAIHIAGPVLFGADWIGPISPRERHILKLGAEDPAYAETARRDRKRQAQFEETERWLLIKGLVENIRGARLVPKTALEEALATVQVVSDRTSADRAPPRQSATMAQSGGGRPRKYDWDAFYQETTRRANTPDGLPDRDVLTHEMGEWCLSTWGCEPPPSTLRKKIAPLYEPKGESFERF